MHNVSEEFLSLHYVAVPAQPWPALEQAWLPHLPAGKRTRVARLRYPADRNASLLGVALLAAAYQRRGERFDPGRLIYPARGKPTIAGGADFSIAHAAGLAVCALASAGRVGVDLEAADSVSTKVLRRALGPAEWARVASGALDATDAWVMTEAVIKAAGLGIAAAGRVRLGEDSGSIDDRPLRLVRVPLAAGQRLWLAHELAQGAVEVVGHDVREFAPLP